MRYVFEEGGRDEGCGEDAGCNAKNPGTFQHDSSDNKDKVPTLQIPIAPVQKAAPVRFRPPSLSGDQAADHPVEIRHAPGERFLHRRGGLARGLTLQRMQIAFKQPPNLSLRVTLRHRANVVVGCNRFHSKPVIRAPRDLPRTVERAQLKKPQPPLQAETIESKRQLKSAAARLRSACRLPRTLTPGVGAFYRAIRTPRQPPRRKQGRARRTIVRSAISFPLSVAARTAA